MRQLQLRVRATVSCRYSSQQQRITAAAVLHSHAAAVLQPLPFTAGAAHSRGSLRSLCFTATPLPFHSRCRFTAATVYSRGDSQQRQLTAAVLHSRAAAVLQPLKVYSKRAGRRGAQTLPPAARVRVCHCEYAWKPHTEENHWTLHCTRPSTLKLLREMAWICLEA